MITQTVRDLTEARAKVAQLEAQLTKELNPALRALPAQYGFDSAQAFVNAVKAASATSRRTSAASPTGPKKRRTRAKITDATRAQVKTLVEEGKTGKEIAETVGISLPSVQNIKKALGLVKQ